MFVISKCSLTTELVTTEFRCTFENLLIFTTLHVFLLLADCGLKFFSLTKLLKHDRKNHTGVKVFIITISLAKIPKNQDRFEEVNNILLVPKRSSFFDQVSKEFELI
jgi:hypothetical protein